MPRLHHWLMAMLIATGLHASIVLTYATLASNEQQGPSGQTGLQAGITSSRVSAPDVAAPSRPRTRHATAASRDQITASRPEESATTAMPTSTMTDMAEIAATTAAAPTAAEPTVPSSQAADEPPTAMKAETAGSPSTQAPPSQPHKATARQTGGTPSTTGTQSDVRRQYEARLRAVLEKNRAYPRRARRLGQEGLIVLTITVARDGRVVTRVLEQPTTYETLNNAVKRMLHTAKPLPAFPDDLNQDEITVRIPVRFSLD